MRRWALSIRCNGSFFIYMINIKRRRHETMPPDFVVMWHSKSPATLSARQNAKKASWQPLKDMCASVPTNSERKIKKDPSNVT